MANHTDSPTAIRTASQSDADTGGTPDASAGVTRGVAALSRRYRQLVEARRDWEPLWQDCYAYALPYRNSFSPTAAGARAAPDRLFDGTAPDAVDQLAASLLAQLTPPWSRWFGLSAGDDLPPDEAPVIARELDAISRTLQSHLDRSNFTVEIHQCFLDLVVGGTASLLFEEAPPGSPSAFRFRAVPLVQLYIAESTDGHLNTTFRRNHLSVAAFRERFPKADLQASLGDLAETDSPHDTMVEVIEAVERVDGDFRYTAFRPEGPDGQPVSLRTGAFNSAPFINFRWMKAPGASLSDAWGRSPVMKALPDIRTAKKIKGVARKKLDVQDSGQPGAAGREIY